MQVAEWHGPATEWDAFVRRARDGTIMHLHGWKAVLEHAYGHRTVQLAAVAMLSAITAELMWRM